MKFTITYTFESKQYTTTWYGDTEEVVVALFKMWHPGYIVVDVKREGHNI